MRNRLHDSSVDLAGEGLLYDESLHSSSEICAFGNAELQRLMDEERPLFRVVLTRLQLVERSGSELQPVESTLVCSEPVRVASFELYDATSIARIMCLGVGRFAHNQLRPYAGADPDAYYLDPTKFDPDGLCAMVSRDHGLVFLGPDGQVKFRDFGTKKGGSRRGSRNGTWLNGTRRVQNTVIDWSEGDFLGIGGRVWVDRDDQLRKEHVFKLRYERLSAEDRAARN